MPAKPATRKGRPPAVEPPVRVSWTMDEPTIRRLTAIQHEHDLGSLSATVRHLAKLYETTKQRPRAAKGEGR